MEPLLAENLIDEIYLQIAPVLLGEGISLFPKKEMLRRFYLTEVKRFGQFAELVYRRNIEI